MNENIGKKLNFFLNMSVSYDILSVKSASESDSTLEKLETIFLNPILTIYCFWRIGHGDFSVKL